jgi:hypothetical protein
MSRNGSDTHWWQRLSPPCLALCCWLITWSASSRFQRANRCLDQEITVKKKQKKRVATAHMPVIWLEADCCWADSKLVFKDYHNGDEVRRVTLLIKDPSDLTYIEERIADIRKHWAAKLGLTIPV